MQSQARSRKLLSIDGISAMFDCLWQQSWKLQVRFYFSLLPLKFMGVWRALVQVQGDELPAKVGEKRRPVEQEQAADAAVAPLAPAHAAPVPAAHQAPLQAAPVPEQPNRVLLQLLQTGNDDSEATQDSGPANCGVWCQQPW